MTEGSDSQGKVVLSLHIATAVDKSHQIKAEAHFECDLSTYQDANRKVTAREHSARVNTAMTYTRHISGREAALFRRACTFMSAGCLMSCLPVDHTAVARRRLDSRQVLQFMLNSRRPL